MRILLSVICLIYAYIFYVFSGYDGNSLNSLFPSPLFNGFLYLMVACFFLFSFSNYSFLRRPEKELKEKKDFEYYKELFKEITKTYSHYLSYVFFYIGVFIVTKFLSGSYFSYCLFFTNIFVITFFILFRNTSFSFDFLRVNQIIFSLIYIYSYIYILFTGNNFFGFIDFVNSFLIIASFLGSLYLSQELRKDIFFMGNLYLYAYVFILYYSFSLFSNSFIFLSIINIIISTLAVYVAPFGGRVFLDPKNIRALGLFAGYFGAIMGAIYLFQYGENILLYIALIASIILNFLFHVRYENYISLVSSIVIFSVLLFVPSFGNIDGAYNFIFVLFFSYFLVLSSCFFKRKHAYDYYFIHGVSYAYNAWGIMLFLIYYSPSLIQLALLMFLEFFYMFLSYYKLTGK